MPGIGTRSHGRRHNLSSITDKGKTKSDATACCARREEVLSMRANHFWPMPGRKIARRTTAAMATGRSGIATLRKEPMQVAPGSAIIGEESTAKGQVSGVREGVTMAQRERDQRSISISVSRFSAFAGAAAEAGAGV